MIENSSLLLEALLQMGSGTWDGCMELVGRGLWPPVVQTSCPRIDSAVFIYNFNDSYG